MKQSISQSGAPPLLLATSLRIPHLHGPLITRSLLIEKIDQVLHYPLTLITAPAGFGKTTLLSQWVSASLTHQAGAAWVSLESECDLRQFWTYVLFALQELKPPVGKSALALAVLMAVRRA